MISARQVPDSGCGLAHKWWYYIAVSDSSRDLLSPRARPRVIAVRKKDYPMRVVRTVLVALTDAPSEFALIGRWAAAGMTALAIAVAVLVSSIIAVMFGLS